MKKKLMVFLLVLFMIFPYSMIISSAETIDDAVIPQESDFNYSGTTLNGFKPAYLESLTEQQKQNIKLIIPEKTTAIGNSAFSGLTYLKGDLVIPDSVTSIGSHAFDGCKNLTGQLTLSQNLQIINSYAFYNCGLTGELVIPNKVTTIKESAFRQGNSYNGFRGILNLPESLITLGNVSFANQLGITSLTIPSQLTEIGASVFKDTGLEGTLIIPGNIQKIGRSAFGCQNLKVVYLPKRLDSNNNSFISEKSFMGQTSACDITSIICDKDDYDYLKRTMHKSEQTKLGYEVDIHFDDGKGGIYETIHGLYNHPYNYQKQGGEWKTISDYCFPTVIGNPNQKWGIPQTSSAPVTEQTNIGDNQTLHAINVYDDPLITYGDGIDKIYDGEAATLTVNATHPLAKPIGIAQAGDVVFYYKWRWVIIGGGPVVAEGFDVNSYDVIDVRMPDYAIECSVKVQACIIKNKDGKLSTEPFKTENHGFSVYLRQAESTVNPIVNIEMRLISQGLPDISLSQADTKGTLAWDKDQTLKLGKHKYTWTFTPEDNNVGNKNYKVKKGEVEIEAVDKFTYTIDVQSTTHGQIILDNQIVNQGQDVSILFKPETGYKLERVYLDDQEITTDIHDGVYQLKNIQSNHSVKATFIALTSTDVEDKIEDLPDIKGNEVINEDRLTVLKTVADYLEISSSDQDKISAEQIQKLYDTLIELPQIEIKIDQEFIQTQDIQSVLESITLNDLNKLISNENTKCQIEIIVKDKELTSEQLKLVDKQIQDINIIQTLDIQIIKTLDSQTSITNLQKPIMLSFLLPNDLPPVQSGYERKFYIVRLHNNGTSIETDILEVENNNEFLTVHTDKFSEYVLGYYDVNRKPNNVEEPSDVIIQDNTTSVNHDEVKAQEQVKTEDDSLLNQFIILSIISSIFIMSMGWFKKHTD